MKIEANLPIMQFQAMGQQNKAAAPKKTVGELLEDMGSPAVKVSISKEGLDAYREKVNEMGEPSKMPDFEEIENNMILVGQTYGSLGTKTRYFATEEEVLEKKDMSQNIIPLWFSNEVKDLEESQGGTTWKDHAMRLAQAYSTLYEGIVQGYQDGTREVRVIEEDATIPDLAQGRGYHVLTMEKELAELDRVYEEKVKDLEWLVKEWPKQFEIALRIDESRSKWRQERRYTPEQVQERLDDYKTIPDDLGQRMMTVRDIWKSTRLNLSKDQAWANVVDMINTMFRKRE